MIIKKLILYILITTLLTSCYYPRVTVSRHKKKNILYKNHEAITFVNEDGNIDKIILQKFSSGYEPNFDFWWRTKFLNSDTVSKKRDYFKRLVSFPNCNNNKIKVPIDILYSKREQDDYITLEFDGFKEHYLLDNYLSDTLVFQNKTNYNDKTCQNNEHCLKRIIYHKTKGIIMLEIGNGYVWRTIN
ncbi:MAG: hypothetical protein K9J13_10200 [Saprospiraceae bacterium]|nr:hypothetical protein [Saprospiraceae bacterium]